MVRAVDDVLGARVIAGVATAAVETDAIRHWRFHAATHPKPGPESEAAGREALSLADHTAREHGVLLVCLSGGASAMMAVPADGLTIADKAATTAVLLRAGLDIGALTLVRRHLSAIKGGQLAARARRSITVAISDVCTPIEDDPAAIGSGPTAPDPTTFAQALDLITSRGLAAEVPEAVVRHLQAGVDGRVGGPVPPGHESIRDAAYWVIASRHDAMRAARETAIRLGYHPLVVAEPTVGEARTAFARLLQRVREVPRPACLIASGETTVVVRGRGRGGRNQELALSALEALARLAPAALASIGTDGIDGPTDAAGAMVDDSVWTRLGPDARSRVAEALASNDAYPVLDELGVIVRTGPSGTNVGDLQVLLLP